jgi:hypothetical protein
MIGRKGKRKKMDKEEKKNHESYGLIELSRVSGDATLFGSCVRHQHYISLTISRAEQVRSLHEDRIYGRDELIRVSFSTVQLGELLTNMNVSGGVPCTLERIMDDKGKYKSIPPPPDTATKQETYVEEFKRDAAAVTTELKALLKRMEELETKASVTKTERREISAGLTKAIMEIESNMPFILTQFNEKVEKVVGEAKGEIEAFQSEMLRRSGLEALGEKMKALGSNPLQLSDGKDDEK